MCFNFQVSISTFIISWSISIFLLNKKLNKKQRQNVIFLMIFSTIQLADAILWYIDMKKNNINYYITSIFIPTILSLQIIYNIFIRNNNSNNLIAVYTIISCIYLFYRFNGYTKCLCDNKFSSPLWGSNEIKIWEFILFAFTVTYPNLKMFSVIMFILFPILHFFIGGAYGSLWCIFGNVVGINYLYNY